MANGTHRPIQHEDMLKALKQLEIPSAVYDYVERTLDAERVRADENAERVKRLNAEIVGMKRVIETIWR